ncbi:carbon monoxide dehydrogenase subunit G [Actinomadura sp. DC4]|uniref:SRPBCC family protein n=1 Tax=Actinomadura sp. DC4 TaxID=3055069 RepID=UPI0025AF4363|nr:carbon monoxide dehydrogenase subunit G [Actinomadura sp. DC4]MDN3358348.1 carbon monoxide dehydrogenase subunit G [Actinomadura sp. DC4]
MKVNGSVSVAAPVPDVWRALQDPAVLARTIPGCERLDEVAPDTYAMTIRAGVASIKGTYAGQVALSDPEPPHAFTLRARGQGAPGTVDATVRVRLSEADGGGTRVDYDADATVGGMIGGVGQRMLASVGKKTAGEFFSAVENAIVGPAVPVPAAAGAVMVPAGQPAAPATYPGSVATGSRSSSDLWAMASAVGAGGFLALAGVAVGWTLARQSRRR